MEELMTHLFAGYEREESLAILLLVLFYFVDRSRSVRSTYIIRQIAFINFLVATLKLTGLTLLLNSVVWVPLFIGLFFGFYVFLPSILRTETNAFAAEVPAEQFTTVAVAWYTVHAILSYTVLYMYPAYETYAWVSIVAGKNFLAGLYLGRFMHYFRKIILAPRNFSVPWALMLFTVIVVELCFALWIFFSSKDCAGLASLCASFGKSLLMVFWL